MNNNLRSYIMSTYGERTLEFSQFLTGQKWTSGNI